MNEGLFFRRADGAEIPVKEVEGLKGNGLLILMTETFLREEDMQKMQQSIAAGRRQRRNAAAPTFANTA